MANKPVVHEPVTLPEQGIVPPVEELRFVFQKETENTLRFKEKPVSGPPRIGTLYVQKWWCGDDYEGDLVVAMRKV